MKFAIFFSLVWLVALSAFGQDDAESVGYWNLQTKTMGGKQFWTDRAHLDGWRIQKNHFTGHHRLLDPNDYRHAWGNLNHCQEILDTKRVEYGLKKCSGKVVVLLHGLVRSHDSMQPMANYLAENGYQVVNFQYASSRGAVGEHAKSLKLIIEELGDDVTEINFVAHSLGNIVIRHYLNDTTVTATGEQGDSRINRMIMLGPPNQGSRMARLMKHSLVFGAVTGSSGTQLSSGWEKLSQNLATPQFEFGIIAGGQDDDATMSNFLLQGKDDFTVSVAESKLVGAHDFLVRPLYHGTMMKDEGVLSATLKFLNAGHFLSENERNPIRTLSD